MLVLREFFNWVLGMTLAAGFIWVLGHARMVWVKPWLWRRHHDRA